MGISKYNSEGYSDPTSHAALSGIRREEKGGEAGIPAACLYMLPVCRGHGGECAESEAVQQVCGKERRDPVCAAPAVPAVPG